MPILGYNVGSKLKTADQYFNQTQQGIEMCEVSHICINEWISVSYFGVQEWDKDVLGGKKKREWNKRARACFR